MPPNYKKKVQVKWSNTFTYTETKLEKLILPAEFRIPHNPETFHPCPMVITPNIDLISLFRLKDVFVFSSFI